MAPTLARGADTTQASGLARSPKCTKAARWFPSERLARFRLGCASVARREHDRVNDGHDAAFRLREGQTVVGPNHALHDRGIRQVRTTVADVRHRAIATDDEAHRNATLEVRVVPETV